MNCYDEGRLMAYLDGQLPPGESRDLEIHLQSCAECRRTFDNLAADKDRLTGALAGYELATQNLPVAQPRSWSAPVSRTQIRKGAVNWMRRYYVWIAAVLVVGLFFGYAPARTLASEFLSVFRVERVQVLHFDPRDVARLEEALRNQHEVNIKNFGRVESEPLTDPVYLRRERMPETVGEYVLEGSHVQPGEVVKITPDVESINRFLQSLGATTLLPPELNGRTFKITVPDVLNAWYRCQETGERFNVSRVAAPSLEVPAGVAMPAVRQALLDVPVLPQGLKRALEGIDDWPRTLPVPDFTGQAREITLDGAPGFFVQGREYPRHPDGGVTHGLMEQPFYGPSLLAWFRDGVWTVLEGRPDTTREEAFDLARQVEAAYGR